MYFQNNAANIGPLCFTGSQFKSLKVEMLSTKSRRKTVEVVMSSNKTSQRDCKSRDVVVKTLQNYYIKVGMSLSKRRSKIIKAEMLSAKTSQKDRKS
jgi:hypothetical protein